MSGTGSGPTVAHVLACTVAQEPTPQMSGNQADAVREQVQCHEQADHSEYGHHHAIAWRWP